MILILVVIAIVICVIGILLMFYLYSHPPQERPYTKYTIILGVASVMTALLMFIGLLINAYSTNSLIDSLVPAMPTINVWIVDENYNLFDVDWRFRDVSYIENEEHEDFFSPVKRRIEFKAQNFGQVEVYSLFNIIDENQNFTSDTQSFTIQPLHTELVTFYVRDKNCIAGWGKSNFKEAEEKCTKELLPTGKMKWYFRTKCPNCKEDGRLVCYTFNLCIYNQTQQEELCKKIWKPEDTILERVKCPEFLE